MDVYRSINEYKAVKKAIATIGTFDGVHLGHVEILNSIITRAEAVNCNSVVITFHPHPRKVLYPNDNDLRLLQTLEEKIERFATLGIDKLLIIPFTLDFSRISAQEFVRTILVDALKIHTIVIGYDHRFGRNRTGGLEELKKAAEQYKFIVDEIPAIQIDNANVSSTKIRNAIIKGDIELANKFLGYKYPLTGKVVDGFHLGKELGFPTANLYVSEQMKLLPAMGVYAIRAIYQGTVYAGMMNIGIRPTLGGTLMGLEAHIIGFDQDIYGDMLTVQFLKRLRNERTFESLNHLVEQLKKDRETCISIYNNTQD